MISLRPPIPADAEALFALIRQTDVNDTLAWDGPETIEAYRAMLAERAAQTERGERHFFTIVQNDDGKPLGSCSLYPDELNFRADLALWLGAPYQGQGFGTATVYRLLEYGYEKLGLEKIEALVFVGNHASRKIFENNGFLMEGTIRKAVRKRGVAIDAWLFGITREDYQRYQYIEGLIVHLCPRKDWQADPLHAYKAASLAEEGFIHCSRAEQIIDVANRYFMDQQDLVLLWIDPKKLIDELRWEAVGDQTYPHIYGPINRNAVVAVTDFHNDSDGVFRSFIQPAF